MKGASIVLVLAGAMTGAAAAYAVLDYLRAAAPAGAGSPGTTNASASPAAPALDEARGPWDIRGPVDAMRASANGNSAREAADSTSVDEAGLAVRTLARDAAGDPHAAFTAALALPDPGSRRWALEKVGAVWALHDPAAAFAAAERLPEDWRERYRARVLEQWALVDIDGAIAFLERIEPRHFPAGLKLQSFIAHDSDRMLALASRLAPEHRRAVDWSSFRALAWREPLDVLERILRLPPSSDRDRNLRDVATQFTQRDPEAALEWLARTPLPSSVRSAVLGAVGRVDIERAVEIVTTMSGNEEEVAEAASAVGRSVDDVQTARVLADRLLDRVDLRAQRLVASIVSRWAQLDPADAAEWVIEHAADIDAFTIRSIAQPYAMRDFWGAVRHGERMPESLRGEWLGDVALQRYEQAPREASAWVESLSGRPYYDALIERLMLRLPSTDPELAARLVARASAPTQIGLVSRIASAWGQRDAAAATAWAERLEVPEARAAALRTLQAEPASSRGGLGLRGLGGGVVPPRAQ